MTTNDLRELFLDLNVKFDEELKKYTNTKTGGKADVLAFPDSIEETEKLIKIAKKNNVPLTILGNASNLIVKDGGIRGLVVILQHLNQITVDGTKVTAQAGASLIGTTRVAAKHSLTGMEFASGIPGSIGGAIFMNAGAYGGEIKNIVESVKLLTRNGEYKTYTVDELDFGYRHSRLQSEDDIVIAATFKLEHGDIKKIRERMEELSFLRASKQPLEYPSCGSVFKRPAGHFTGKLVHDSGLQGYTVGGVQVSKKHAGFIVNIGNGTGKDYLDVIHHVQAVVKEKFDVELETEVRIIGED